VGAYTSGGEQGVRNRMDGRAEIALQARDVHGGVHFHGRGHTLAAPRQVPAPTRNFTNQVRVLAAADREPANLFLTTSYSAEAPLPASAAAMETRIGSGMQSPDVARWIMGAVGAHCDNSKRAELQFR
jgi:hypothetical protein